MKQHVTKRYVDPLKEHYTEPPIWVVCQTHLSIHRQTTVCKNPRKSD